jgi:cell wall-associated NlpC family hydrolase
MTRRCVAVLSTALMLLSLSGVAWAQSAAEDRLGDAEKKLTELNTETERAAERYNSARVRLDRVRSDGVRIAAASAWLTLAVDRKRRDVAGVAVAAYKRGPSSLGALLGSADFTSLSDRSRYLGRISDQEKGRLDGLKATRSDLDAAQAKLDENRRQAEAEVTTVAAEKDRVEALLADQQILVGQYRDEVTQIKAARAAEAEAARKKAEQVAAASAPAPASGASAGPATTAAATTSAPTIPAATDAPATTAADGSATEAATVPPATDAATSRPPATEAPTTEPPTTTTEPPDLPSSPGASTAVEWAKAQLGKPYVYGDNGPDSFDCSGLVQYVWGKAGVDLPHAVDAQYYALPHVSRDQLQPGDIVVFGDDLHHDGIYVGNNTMIHAPQTGEYVSYQDIDRQDYFGAARPG